MKLTIIAAATAVLSGTTAFAIPTDEPVTLPNGEQVHLAIHVYDPTYDELINRPVRPGIKVVDQPGIIQPEEGAPEGPIVHVSTKVEEPRTLFDPSQPEPGNVTLAGKWEVEISPYIESNPDGRSGGAKATLRYTFS